MRFVFAEIACGSKTNICHKVFTSSVCFADSFPIGEAFIEAYVSRANCSEAFTLGNATACQGLPY